MKNILAKLTLLENTQVNELKAGDKYGDAAGGMQTDSVVMYEDDIEWPEEVKSKRFPGDTRPDSDFNDDDDEENEPHPYNIPEENIMDDFNNFDPPVDSAGVDNGAFSGDDFAAHGESKEYNMREDDNMPVEPKAWKVLKGTDDKIYQIYVMHNFYAGKYYDYSGRAYPILASSPEEALAIARKYKGEIEADLRSKFFKVGSRRVRMISKNDKHHLKDSSFHSPKYPSMWKYGNKHVINRDGEFVSFSPDEETVDESTVNEVPRGSTEQLSVGNEVRSRNPNNGTYGMLMTVKEIDGDKIYCGGKNLQTMPYRRSQLELLNPPQQKAPTEFDESKLTEKSKSKKQARFMAACAHGADYSSCPPTSVAKEFNRADTGTKLLKKESKENNMRKLKESIQVNDPSLEKVLRHFGKEVRDFQETGELDDNLYSVLYDFYFDEMPYGTKKARTGDPVEWISDRLDDELSDVSTGHPADLEQFNSEFEMGEGAAGDFGGDVGSGNDISPLSQTSIDEDDDGYEDSYEDENEELYDGCHVEDTANPGEIFVMNGDPDSRRVRIEDKDGRGWYITPHRLKMVTDEDRIARWFPAAGDFRGRQEWDQSLDEAPVDIEAVKARMAQRQATNAQIAAGQNPGFTPPKNTNPFMAKAAPSSNPRADMRQGEDEFRMGVAEDEMVDETFLVENNEDLITEILEEHGLDHGLDFFFDNGLVAIGKSTARVIINALKLDPRVKATPSFGRIDGEEVQIAFNKEAGPEVSNSEIKDLSQEPEHDEFAEGMDHNEVAHLLAKAGRVMNSATTMDQLRVAEKYAQLAYRKIKGTESGFGSNFERNMGIYSDFMQDALRKEKEIKQGGLTIATEEGNDDELNDMRRLSGLPAKELDESGCEICGRGSCTRSFHSLSDQEDFDSKTGKYAPDEDIENVEPEELGPEEVEESSSNELEIGDRVTVSGNIGKFARYAGGPKFQKGEKFIVSRLVGDNVYVTMPSGEKIGIMIPKAYLVKEVEEAEEGEYVNAPDPTVHTSTTDMINRGNDLNRPKRQDYTVRNLGNNPMAETRNLFKQYEAMKDSVKK